jgi:hypothetical protein
MSRKRTVERTKETREVDMKANGAFSINGMIVVVTFAALVVSASPTMGQDVMNVINNRVGIGTSSPDRLLKVVGTDQTTTRVEVLNNNAAVANRTLFKIDNNGPATFAIENSAISQQWTFAVGNSGFAISKAGSGVQEMLVLSGGNMNIAGTLTQGSSRDIKTAFTPVDTLEILSLVAELPLSMWSYKLDEGGARHLGPMAEDFHSSFGLGNTNKGIASLDTSGVALAAIQGLYQLIEEKDRTISDLIEEKDRTISDLEARLERLERDLEGHAE